MMPASACSNVDLPEPDSHDRDAFACLDAEIHVIERQHVCGVRCSLLGRIIHDQIGRVKYVFHVSYGTETDWSRPSDGGMNLQVSFRHASSARISVIADCG